MTQLRFNVFFFKCDLGLDSTKGKRLIYGHAKKRKRPEMHGNSPVCLLESSFLLESEFRGKWIPGKWILRKYFPMFGSVIENKLENTFQCLVMSWKMSWKITY